MLPRIRGSSRIDVRTAIVLNFVSDIVDEIEYIVNLVYIQQKYLMQSKGIFCVLDLENNGYLYLTQYKQNTRSFQEGEIGLITLTYI